MNKALSLVIPRFSFRSWNGLTKSLRNSPQFVSIIEQAAPHVFWVQAIYPNQFVARLVTAVQHNGMPREFHLLGEKAHQRRIGLPFDRVRPPHYRSWHSEQREPAELPFGQSYQNRGELARRILGPRAMMHR